MTTPSDPSPDDQARWIATYLCDVLGEHLASPPLDWPAIRDAVTAALHAHGLAERRAGIEQAAQIVENGSFLTDSSPAYRFAKECAAAIRRSLPLPGDDSE